MCGEAAVLYYAAANLLGEGQGTCGSEGRPEGAAASSGPTAADCGGIRPGGGNIIAKLLEAEKEKVVKK